MIKGDSEEKFHLDTVTGVVSVEHPENLADAYELEVSVSDGKYSAGSVVKINCLRDDDNSLRFAAERYEASIEENSTRILIVEIVNLLGAELNEHVEFAILNPTDKFEIGLTSGAIKTKGIPFDREVQDKYEIIVEVSAECRECQDEIKWYFCSSVL
jgi:protocadherin Fat 1/2/3